MKKRIGSKLYDTDSSELVYESVFGKLYRKRTREKEWFLVNDEHVIPMQDAEARAFMGETSYREKPVDEKRIMIAVDRETHGIISKRAKQHSVSITEEVRQIVKEVCK
ncbi:MAG: hypothetical protein J6W04_00185 [Bacteroidales bacterium]|nr:hypothetical protein [Bacteroidales bacterium]